MLSDHILAGYNHAFENLLSINIIERKVWASMPVKRREMVRNHLNSYGNEQIFSEKYEVSKVYSEMQRNSHYKKKAFQAGMIRPFLMFVSMTPKRRSAISALLGVSIINQYWYLSFNSHKESWFIIKHLQSKSNTLFSTLSFSFLSFFLSSSSPFLFSLPPSPLISLSKLQLLSCTLFPFPLTPCLLLASFPSPFPFLSKYKL